MKVAVYNLPDDAPFGAIQDVADVFCDGAKTHELFAWKDVDNFQRFKIHLGEWMSKNKHDQDSGHQHLVNAISRLLCVYQKEIEEEK